MRELQRMLRKRRIDLNESVVVLDDNKQLAISAVSDMNCLL